MKCTGNAVIIIHMAQFLPRKFADTQVEIRQLWPWRKCAYMYKYMLNFLECVHPREAWCNIRLLWSVLYTMAWYSTSLQVMKAISVKSNRISNVRGTSTIQHSIAEPLWELKFVTDYDLAGISALGRQCGLYPALLHFSAFRNGEMNK